MQKMGIGNPKVQFIDSVKLGKVGKVAVRLI